MKQTIIACVYLFTVFAMYLLVSFIISIIGDYEFRYILTHPSQILGLICFYSWCPAIFVACDLDERIESWENEAEYKKFN